MHQQPRGGRFGSGGQKAVKAVKPPPKAASDTEDNFSYTPPHASGLLLTDDDKYHIAKMFIAFRKVNEIGKEKGATGDKYMRHAVKNVMPGSRMVGMLQALQGLYGEYGRRLNIDSNRLGKQIAKMRELLKVRTYTHARASIVLLCVFICVCLCSTHALVCRLVYSARVIKSRLVCRSEHGAL
jgi:hypothetical protein